MFGCNEILGVVYWKGHRVPLSFFQVRFVCYLAKNAGRVVTHKEIHQKFYGGRAIGNPLFGGINNVNGCVVYKIIKTFNKISPGFSAIKTIRGKDGGYTWIPPEEESAKPTRLAA